MSSGFDRNKCDVCGQTNRPLYFPPWDDGTYTGTCGHCLWKDRDKLKNALSRVVHEMGIAKTALEGI